MPGKERRICPRKDCALPVRFRVVLNATSLLSPANVAGAAESLAGTAVTIATAGARTILEGQVVNLSERGLYVHCKEPLGVGTALEMFFTLARELTGRSPEEVSCRARVVHMKQPEVGEPAGMGAAVERFEPVHGAGRTERASEPVSHWPQ